jgi:hypothetical protein
MMEDSTCASPFGDRRTTEAAVSSQLVSMPRTVSALPLGSLSPAARARSAFGFAGSFSLLRSPEFRTGVR